MAENTIDNLSIQVVASAEKAISTFNRLASGASGLKNAANGAAGGMQDMAQGAKDAGSATQQAGTQAGKARPNIKGVGKDAKDAGDNAKTGSSGLATFWQSLKRIAYYRMIRSIIKSIGQAFKEGAQNLYQWSSANPGLSDFAKNMNRISTSVTYLKNSLGAMLEPIVRILTPVIEWVIDKLVWLIDKVNQFFAALSGAETYTAAKKVAQTWGDTSQQVANNTHKAAEEIKRTILGFDEINKLDKPNSGSYGGGSGLPSASAAAQDMFEERPLEGWAKAISDFIRRIKDFFDGIFGPIKQLFTDAGNAFDDLDRSLDAAQQEDKTVNINVKINTTAEKLWNDFVDEWNAIKDKILFFKISPTPPVDLLWRKITDAWDNIKDKVLYANVSLSQKASYLWTTLKDAWNNIKDKVLYSNVSLSQKANYLWTTLSNAWDGIKNKVLYADVMLSQKANYLWTTLSNAWGSIQGKVLYVDVMLSQKANYLWTTLSNAWNGIQNKVLYTEVMLSQKANYLWTTLSNAWDGIQGKVLYVNVEFSQKANYLWTTLQSAWDNIQNKVLYANVSLSQKATYLWDTLKKAWNSIQNKVVYLNVSLSQSANYLWTTLKNAWDGIQNKVVYANVSLSQSANYLWTTLKSAWDNIQGKVVYLTVEFTQKANYLWTTLKNAWDGIEGKVLYANVSLSQKANYLWTTLKNAWDGIKDKVLYVEVKLKKNGWTTVTDFVDNSFGGATGGGGKTSGGGAGRSIGVGVKLQENTADKGSKSLWDMWWGIFNKTLEIEQDIIIKAVGGKGIKRVGNDKNALNDFSPSTVTVNSKPGNGFTGKLSGTNTYTLKGIEDTSVKVGAAPNWASTIGGLVPYLQIDNLSTTIKALAKKGWGTKTFKGAVGASDTTTSITANLSKKWGTQSPVNYLGLSGLSTSIKVGLAIDQKTSKIKARVAKGEMSLEMYEQTKANGGVFSNGRWSNIPQYANGTLNAGTIFAAGEAGPEVVGHVGGRTEVLNKSQLASAMFSAVKAAMAPAAANFASAAQSMGVADAGVDMETLAEMIRQGVEQAMARSNDYDRQKVALLQQINEKDYNPEISTSSINRAQQRMNRRAGTTIVPVGT